MNISSYNIPAFVGEQRGHLLSINESNNTCRIQFGKRILTVDMRDVYLNEGFIDKIKQAGKAVWQEIKNAIISVKGFIFPETGSLEESLLYINNPVNIIGMDLPLGASYAPTKMALVTAKSAGMDIINDNTIKDSVNDCQELELEQANKRFKQVLTTYVKNENMTFKEAVRAVNEKYYHESKAFKQFKSLNESISGGAVSDFYGDPKSTTELVGIIKDSIKSLISNTGKVKPIVIWGPPGIGKTTIVGTATEMLRRENYEIAMITLTCPFLSPDSFSLPLNVKNKFGDIMSTETPKTWLPCYPKHYVNPRMWDTIGKYKDAIYNAGTFVELDDDQAGPDKVEKYKKELKNIGYDINKKDFIDAFVDHRAPQLSIRKTQADDTDNAVENVQKLDDSIMFAWKDQYNEKIFGGVLYLDEFTRASRAVHKVIMQLSSDRILGEAVLGTHWSIVCSANRLIDDNYIDEMGDEREWTIPEKDRYDHYFFKPTVEEWLNWARHPRNPKKGNYELNIDEYFCQFIEASKTADGKGYLPILDDYFDEGSNANLDDATYKGINGATMKHKKSNNKDFINWVKNMYSLIDKEENPHNTSMRTYTRRDWERSVQAKFKQALLSIFKNFPDLYKYIYAETPQSGYDPITQDPEEWVTRNIDFGKLENLLNNVSYQAKVLAQSEGAQLAVEKMNKDPRYSSMPNDKKMETYVQNAISKFDEDWKEWAREHKEGVKDESTDVFDISSVRNINNRNDRYNWFMDYVRYNIINGTFYAGSKPRAQFKTYTSWKRFWTKEIIDGIWRTGHFGEAYKAKDRFDLLTQVEKHCSNINDVDISDGEEGTAKITPTLLYKADILWQGSKSTTRYNGLIDSWKESQPLITRVFQNLINNGIYSLPDELRDAVSKDDLKLFNLWLKDKTFSSITPQDIEDMRNEFAFVLYNKDNKKGEIVEPFYDPSSSGLSNSTNSVTYEAMAFMVKNSEVVRNLTHLFQYIYQICLSTETKTLSNTPDLKILMEIVQDGCMQVIPEITLTMGSSMINTYLYHISSYIDILAACLKNATISK